LAHYAKLLHLHALSKRGQLVGADIVEVNPYLDHAELTQQISVQLLIEALGSVDSGRDRFRNRLNNELVDANAKPLR